MAPQLLLCVSDGELASSAQIQVLATASTPMVLNQTASPNISVPLGSVVSVWVEAECIPPPSYQWQYRSYANVTTPTNTSVNSSSLVARDDDETSLDRYEYDTEEVEEHWFGERKIVEVLHHLTILLSPPLSHSGSIPGMPAMQVWNSIPGATSATYHINGTDNINNQTIRCLITNSGGSATSQEYTISITAAISPSSVPSSGGSGRYNNNPCLFVADQF